MSTNALLSTIILVAFIVTVVLAIGSYLAYKYREGRRPRSDREDGAHGEPIFFERFFPQGVRRDAGDEPLAAADESVRRA